MRCERVCDVIDRLTACWNFGSVVLKLIDQLLINRFNFKRLHCTWWANRSASKPTEQQSCCCSVVLASRLCMRLVRAPKWRGANRSRIWPRSTDWLAGSSLWLTKTATNQRGLLVVLDVLVDLHKHLPASWRGVHRAHNRRSECLLKPANYIIISLDLKMEAQRRALSLFSDCNFATFRSSRLRQSQWRFSTLFFPQLHVTLRARAAAMPLKAGRWRQTAHLPGFLQAAARTPSPDDSNSTSYRSATERLDIKRLASCLFDEQVSEKYPLRVFVVCRINLVAIWAPKLAEFKF